MPISLPASESVAGWQSAFELADLRAARTRAEAVVRVREVGGTWQIVAVAPDLRERSETVPRPDTPLEREEVALLAQSLVRDLGAAEAPPLLLPIPPPPPPPAPPPPPVLQAEPPPAAPAPTPKAPEPANEPTDAAPIPLEPAPEPAAPEPARPEPKAEPDGMVPVTEAVPDPDPQPVDVAAPEPEIAPRPMPDSPSETDTSKPGRARTRLSTPAFHLGPAHAIRGNTDPAFGFDVGLVPLERGWFSLALEGLLFAPTQLKLGGIDRTLLYGSARVTAGANIGRFTIQAGFGLGVLDFRQEYRAVDTLTVPQVHAGLTLDTWRHRWLTVQIRAHGAIDLTPMAWIDERDHRSLQAPVSLLISVPVRFSDPNRDVATSAP